MSWLDRIASFLIREDPEFPRPTTYAEELGRQCNSITDLALAVCLVLWLPYIPLHARLFAGYPALLVNDVTLSVVSLVLILLRRTRAFRHRGYPLLMVLICYVTLGGAITTGLVKADSSYVGGYIAIVYVLMAIPFRRRHSLAILGASLTAFTITGVFTDVSFFTSVRGLFDVLNLFVAVFITTIAIFILDSVRRNMYQQQVIIEEERKKSDRLLANILPESVAEELKERGKVEPVHYDCVTVLFADFVGFTRISTQLSPQELVRELERYFERFDQIVEQHGVEKLKTIGDAYMCAGGLPEPNATHAVDCLLVALQMQAAVEDIQRERERDTSSTPTWTLRIGIHTGPVVAAVIGHQKFSYDIWGDTVNTASRIESSGQAGRITVSEDTYRLIQEVVDAEPRGHVEMKGKGTLLLHFVTGLKPALASDEQGRIPNARFHETLKRIGE